jgi:hypothetical protein
MLLYLVQLLNGDDNTFKRGGCDKFTITGIEVGESRVVELRLVGTGNRPASHMSTCLSVVTGAAANAIIFTENASRVWLMQRFTNQMYQWCGNCVVLFV